MAKASTPTLLSLDQYAFITGQEPRHFNSVICAQFPPKRDVSTLWYQHGWMASGKASREELAVAIAEAEQTIAERLRYWPAPVWITNEVHQFPRATGLPEVGLLQLHDIPAGYRDFYRLYPRMTLNWGHLQAPGRRRVQEVALDVTVDYIDNDGDGFKETAEIVIPDIDASGWSAGEIIVVHNDDVSCENRIRFLRFTLLETGITIRGNSAQFVLPDLWEYYGTEEGATRGIDGDDPDNYLTTVNVYRETTTTEGEDNAPVEFLRQSTATTDPTYYAARRGVMQVRDGVTSDVHVIPATWDEDDAVWVAGSLPGRPDVVRCHYQAGVALNAHGWMSPRMARAVAALATARVAKTLDTYGPPQNLVERWQMIPDNPPYAQQICPWGAQNGAWEAYQLVTRELHAPMGISV